MMDCYFSVMGTTIHIGREIEKRIKELGLVKKYVAEQMNMSPQNLNNVFQAEAIRTDQLEKFSEVLDKNFFLLYRDLIEGGEDELSPRKIEISIDDKGDITSPGVSKKLEKLQLKVEQLSDSIIELIELKHLAKYLYEQSSEGEKPAAGSGRKKAQKPKPKPKSENDSDT